MGVIKTSKENATPEIPPAGFCKLYFKTDGGLYRLDEAGIETLISDTDVLAKVSSNDTIAKYLEDAIIVANGTNSTNALEISTINDGGDEDIEISFDETKLSVTSSQITDFSTAVANAETDTTLQKIGNTLRYIGEDGTNQDINLSIYLDDTNLARLTSATLDGVTGIATFTRDDATTFTLDLSNLLDNQNASEVTVTPTGNLTSTDVQNALEELQGDVDTLSGSSHDAVTLNIDAPTQESANLVGQELQLNQATASTDGVMSSEDKTKLDAIASGANNYTHPNHTGEVTSIGDGAQTLDKTAITNKTTISAEAGDFVLVSDTSDGGNLKKVNVDDLLDDTNTGENNTASNVGVGGVGVFKQKTGVDLEFKNVNAGSNKISVVDDVANNEIDIDVNENNLTLTASQISDFDAEVSNNTSVTANSAKVTNATHTGEVTGSGVLTVDKTAISNQTQVTAATDDYVLIGDTSDTDNLKKVTVQSIADLGGGDTIHIDLGNNNVSKEVSKNTTNLVLKEFIYRGTSETLTEAKALFSNDNLASATLEVYDFTNSLIIASHTATNGVYEIKDLGTISNLPTSDAIFQIRVSTGSGSNQDTAHFTCVRLGF